TTLSSMSPAPTEIYTLSLHDALPICKLPELGAMLKEKLHVFDRPLMLWQELQSMLGGPDPLTTLHLPKIDWVQPTLEFLSPTFAEFLLFVATLILFIASWRELRRALIMNFGERAWRLR